jgi:small-conductance mechanosensitive channel
MVRAIIAIIGVVLLAAIVVGGALLFVPQTEQWLTDNIPALQDLGWRLLGCIAVVILAMIALKLIRRIGEPLIERIVNRTKRSEFSADEQQRARTLLTVLMTSARIAVFVVALMFILSRFDVDYGPLLVAAGGVSLALGFGAQSLIRDFFAGFFILLEGQYNIGDVVEINGKSGTVEKLNLRTTVLRDIGGEVHTIPNGEIKLTSNQTKQWSRAIVDVSVAYEENIDDVGKTLQAVANEMHAVEPWDKKLLEWDVMGVERFDTYAVIVRVLLKTRAGEQWGVAREFRRRCKLKFDELGIELPVPRQLQIQKVFEEDGEGAETGRRKKRAGVLRYVRGQVGEGDEDDGRAAMSVEERDRARSIAQREVDLAKSDGDGAPVTHDNHTPEAEKAGREMAAVKAARNPGDDTADPLKPT